MSLNIKNEQTHELVRRLAQITGSSQTQAVADAVSQRLDELERAQGLPDLQWQRVEIVLQEASRRLTPEQKAALADAEQDIYDQDGLPA